MELASNVILKENCFAAMLSKLPKNMGDPGSLTVPYQIVILATSHALADLGASVNLLQFLFYKKLNLPEPRPI